jgi:hypothetical protein
MLNRSGSAGNVALNVLQIRSQERIKLMQFESDCKLRKEQSVTVYGPDSMIGPTVAPLLDALSSTLTESLGRNTKGNVKAPLMWQLLPIFAKARKFDAQWS